MNTEYFVVPALTLLFWLYNKIRTKTITFLIYPGYTTTVRIKNCRSSECIYPQAKKSFEDSSDVWRIENKRPEKWIIEIHYIGGTPTISREKTNKETP